METVAEPISPGEQPPLEKLARPLLEALNRATGLESTYLTEIHIDLDQQEIRFASNTGDLQMPEGLRLRWAEALCARALADGIHYTDDVPGTWPDIKTARRLGLKTYAGVPVVTEDQRVFGTLCGASRDSIYIEPAAIELMHTFARLIADQAARELAADTDRRRAERAEDKLRSRAMFLAEAEHKLKSPLTVVSGWALMLESKWDRMDDDMRLKGVETLRRSADQLVEQVNRLLEEAQAEVLASDLDLMWIDVGHLVEASVAEFNGVSRLHEVAAECAPDVYALGDDRALRQILSHLLENALKYSPDGGRTVVRASSDEDGVVIEVCDEGIGIPDDVDLFRAFQRGDAAASRPGIGLGLHIVRNLAEAMAGTVTVRRNEGAGSTFTVTLPAPLVT